MKVLLVEFDLYQKTGGGQTFYRNIIKKYPEIDFYYFSVQEEICNKRPNNAHAIQYSELYFPYQFKSFYDISPPKWTLSAFIKANNVSASVAATGNHYDIIDIPDYEQFGMLLRPALKLHHVSFGKLALSMHGLISKTKSLNWSTEGMSEFELESQERLQFSSVDIRYGISKSYIEEIKTDLPCHYINPLSIFTFSAPHQIQNSELPPDLNFVGRTEKRKGPDIFVDLVWWLPRSSYNTANIFGPDSYDPDGVSSASYLIDMIKRRGNDIAINGTLNQEELKTLFASRSITVLPSRYDTFNLVALESLFSGCPTAIGTGAGICSFLDEQFPSLPYVKIDINSIYSCLASLISLLANYDEERKKLLDVLLSSNVKVTGPSLKEIYQSPSKYNEHDREVLENWHFKINSKKYRTLSPIRTIVGYPLKFVKFHIPAFYKDKIKRIIFIMKPESILTRLRNNRLSIWYQSAVLGLQFRNSLRIGSFYERLFNLPEKNELDIAKKIGKCWEFGSTLKVDRVRLWQEIARLEEIRGNNLISAVYKLRSMRLLDSDRFSDLAFVIRVLEEHGFKKEANIAKVMFGNSPDREKQCLDLLDKAFHENKGLETKNYEILDDRRNKTLYKASVIVSLYNAASKLPLFLMSLQNQTLLKSGEAELILVDSGSPSNEYQVFKSCMERMKLQVLYVRSDVRETIQGAWNRGISLSKGEYLSFLGVDETLHPECLEILSGELDKDASVDWVQGNSLVTSVNKDGQWVKDIMVYNRDNYSQDFVYLETCYLSWVGALYRRSIHLRYGYYDDSFRAAGDTEFKGRILPFIKSKAVNKTLGIFLNYPEDRTTQHPRAEIEDLRAWYLHRTLAGIRYAFSKKDTIEVEKLIRASLKYRKSYCMHWSTDLDYTTKLFQFLRDRTSDSSLFKYNEDILRLHEAYKSLEFIEKPSGFNASLILAKVYLLANKIQKKHRSIDDSLEPIYRIFNDNRHEQHSNLWVNQIT